MRRFLILFCTTVLFTGAAHAAPPASPLDWKTRVDGSIPLLGHRNWILVVDSAYPLQSSPGVETIETSAPHLDVVRYVLGAVSHSIHVRPQIYMDAELPFVPDDDAPGASDYRARIRNLFHGLPVQEIPHEKMISTLDETSRQFHVLVLKTTMTIPYTSVFIRLDCKYWSSDAEARMREMMNASKSNPTASPASKPNH